MEALKGQSRGAETGCWDPPAEKAGGWYALLEPQAGLGCLHLAPASQVPIPQPGRCVLSHLGMPQSPSLTTAGAWQLG